MSRTFQRCGRSTSLGVHPVRRDRDRGHVRNEVVEQDLLGRERQERQERCGQRHAHHVAEVGAGRDADVLERVGEGAAAVLDASPQHVEIAAAPARCRRFPAPRRPPVDRNADVGRVQRRCIVDAVAQVTDRVAGALQARTMRSFCCGSTSTNKSVCSARCHKASSSQHAHLFAREHRFGPQTDRLRHVRRDVAVVSADDLDAYPERSQVADGAPARRLWADRRTAGIRRSDMPLSSSRLVARLAAPPL